MRAALALAQRGLGRVWPNPAVGCVLVREGARAAPGEVIARGWTQPGGRPHAETEALGRAGEGARGATAYVSLEPCAHHGKTPPCADALVAAGVGRVVAAIEDPDPRVAGRGLARLRAAGIPVTLGVGAAEAEELNAGFFSRIKQGRPLVTLKLASSLDGRIATRRGDSRWITGEAARRRAHGLRASHDAILVGTETALADDPELTCRLPGLADRSPVRIVLDRQLRLPLTAKLIAGARRQPTWLATASESDVARRAVLAGQGVQIIEVPPETSRDSGGRLSLPALLHALGERGITRLLVEGGGRLAAALLAADLIDRLVWFRAAALIGGDGLPALAELGIDRVADAARFRRIAVVPVGDDIVETYRRL
jgi:diaminohydroxyphosphoribosylaminopyrimidine deaminase/5-amino-6-(5-phosphoribosylamino)uracil reductase